MEPSSEPLAMSSEWLVRVGTVHGVHGYPKLALDMHHAPCSKHEACHTFAMQDLAGSLCSDHAEPTKTLGCFAAVKTAGNQWLLRLPIPSKREVSSGMLGRNPRARLPSEGHGHHERIFCIVDVLCFRRLPHDSSCWRGILRCCLGIECREQQDHLALCILPL